MTAVLVFVGAMVGAPLRYLTDRFVQSRRDSLFPWGTFSVNLAGCLVLGALAGAGTALPSQVFTLVGTGFCGALTTYSTFSYETLRLVEQKAYLYAVLNAAVSIIAGLGAVLLAFTTTVALIG
ncbi:fluoride efflux transporter CrcB [Lentzea sp. BCCO 10_0798]|uniref:Fluoride-specific ion channel FluC n=1 Tax=Lentzea kristufekii TaxID=3095430 RepID=A0ABU4TJL1_9PSEU|nr:fluoride efflux transporter CrcB [Lentzea sp. BCCO 10_0798]MDX8048459.1 fluoride efflux transporter CrcB [Lentzea sp. BCCO 10_0798]